MGEGVMTARFGTGGVQNWLNINGIGWRQARAIEICILVLCTGSNEKENAKNKWCQTFVNQVNRLSVHRISFRY